MICPRCGQDELVKARIKKSGILIYICPECDATWQSNFDINPGNFLDYGSYMESIGLSKLWDELEVIGGI